MDQSGITRLQQLVDDRLSGTLQQRVERLRREGCSWRGIAGYVSALTDVPVSKSTLHVWATAGGWQTELGAEEEAS
jgi:hypothetical protein